MTVRLSIITRRRGVLGGWLLALSALLASGSWANGYQPSPYVGSGAPYAGSANHAQVTPAFHWGWFGADRYQPRASWHRDYNGELVRWNRYRRY